MKNVIHLHKIFYRLATFSLYSDSTQKDTSETANPANLALVSSAPASNTAIVIADYAIANWGSVRFATDILLTTFSATSAYHDFALNSSGIANISKTGISKFGIRASSDIDRDRSQKCV